MEPKETDKYKYCNHYHELTPKHEIVDFGDGEFVANKEAIPLLKALHDVGLRTRTHHIDKNTNNFISIILDNATIEIQTVHENHSDRIKYNGKQEVLIQWTNQKK